MGTDWTSESNRATGNAFYLWLSHLKHYLTLDNLPYVHPGRCGVPAVAGSMTSGSLGGRDCPRQRSPVWWKSAPLSGALHAPQQERGAMSGPEWHAERQPEERLVIERSKLIGHARPGELSVSRIAEHNRRAPVDA